MRKSLMKTILNILVLIFVAIQFSNNAYADSTIFMKSNVTARAINGRRGGGEGLPKYDGSTRYNNVQQSTNETMREFSFATKRAEKKGLKSFHDFALDIAITHLRTYGTNYMSDSEIEVLSIEHPDVLSSVASDQVTLSKYQVALYKCHDQWIRSDKYKRGYIEYINAL